MAKPAIGMIETKGLTALVMAADAMLKSAAVEFIGWKKIGSGLCSCYIQGDVAAVEGRVGRGRSRRPGVGPGRLLAAAVAAPRRNPEHAPQAVSRPASRLSCF